MQQKKNSIGPILFLYYGESLVSSNLNSNILWFHCAHPNEQTNGRSGFPFPLRIVGGQLEFVARILGGYPKLSSSGLAISMTNLIVQNL
jgi:hypothetical protein